MTNDICIVWHKVRRYVGTYLCIGRDVDPLMRSAIIKVGRASARMHTLIWVGGSVHVACCIYRIAAHAQTAGPIKLCFCRGCNSRSNIHILM